MAARAEWCGRSDGAYFVPNELGSSPELSASVREHLNLALAACDQAGRDVWQYVSWEERAVRFLQPAYVLYLLLIAHGRPAVDELVRADDAKFGRKRRPSGSKPALLAVGYTVRPRIKEQRQRVSAWAPLISDFATRGVTPEQFEEALKQTTLRQCTLDERAKRQALRTASPATEEEAGPDAASAPPAAGTSDDNTAASVRREVDADQPRLAAGSSRTGGEYTLRLAIVHDRGAACELALRLDEDTARLVAEILEAAPHSRLRPRDLMSVARALHADAGRNRAGVGDSHRRQAR